MRIGIDFDDTLNDYRGLLRKLVQQRFGKELDEEMKIGALLLMAPEKIRSHAYLNEDRYQTYAVCRKLIMD